MGVAHDKLGDHKAAQAFYRTGLTHEPGYLNMHNNLALSLALVGQYDEAIKIMRRVAADPRAGSRQRLNLALVYGLAGDSESAASVARIDLDERSVGKNLAYYRTLRAMNDSRAAINAIGAYGVLDIGARSR
jgi:Flp pilus assembly protein TadD